MDLVPAPDSLGLPAPVWLILTLHETTQTIHFLLMNFVVASSWFTIWLHFGRSVDWKDQLYHRCLAALPVVLSLTITFGVAPLLFVQTLFGQFFYTANVLMGWFWLGLLGVLVTAFYLIYVLKSQRRDSDRVASPTIRLALHLTIAAAFTVIAFLHTANAVLTISPNLWEGAYVESLWGTLFRESDILIPRFLHNFVGALGIGGLWIVWIGNHRGSLNPSDAARSGALLALGATFPQMVIGFWYLSALPSETLRDLMRFDSSASWHLLSSIVLAIPFAVCLAALTVVPCHRGLRWTASTLGGLLVFGMVTFSEKLREILLADYFSLSDWTVDPQWGPIWIFLGLFVVGLAVLAWMGWVLWTGFAEPSSDENRYETE